MIKLACFNRGFAVYLHKFEGDFFTMLTRKKILLSVSVTALVIRIAFAVIFSGSFFASYHLVPGLDMQTLLRFSEWAPGNDHLPFFTFHRVLLYLIWIINGQNHCVWAAFVIQSLLGVAGTAAVADITLRLCRNRKAALIAGIASAAYLPLLVYEFSILQETFMVNFALLTFWSMFHALKRRFDTFPSLLFSVVMFAALAGRPAAVFMGAAIWIFVIYKMFKRKLLKKLLLPVAVLLILLAGASIFNKHFFGWFSPFYRVMPYTVAYNTGTTDGVSAVSTADVWHSAVNAARRVPTLFKYGELPENQNIYFWCEKIPLLILLISPGILIPCAVAGIVVLLLSGAWKKRYGLLLIPVVMLALPLCAREAIGRYRLMLVPYFFMIAACAAVIYCRMRYGKRKILVVTGALAGFCFSVYDGDVPERIRASDYHAYALAMENTSGTDKEEILKEYFRYWERSDFRGSRAFRVMMDKALQFGNIPVALAVAGQAEISGSISPDLINYYRAWCFALSNMPEKVEEHLRAIKNVRSLPPDACKNAFMLRDKTAEILKRRKL